MNIESAVNELINLAEKPLLSKSAREQARQAMIMLKEAGMTNEEIAKIAKGRWSASTIKGYTKGAKTSGPSQWHEITAVLENVISAGLSLDDVRETVEIDGYLESMGISLKQVADLIIAAESASLSVEVLIQQSQALNENGLSAKDMSVALTLKKSLEDNGLTLDVLPSLAELAGNFGDRDKVVEAVAAYGSLNEILDRIAKDSEELTRLDEQVASKSQQVMEMEAKLSGAKDKLQSYEKTVELGFGEEQLARLNLVGQKYGGVKEVLRAVEAYDGYAEILEKTKTAKSNLGSLQAKVTKVEAEHAHIKASIDMCATLMHRYKFGVEAIATLFSIAQKYGEPVEVLKAVESYGKLSFVRHEINKLEGAISQRQKLTAEQEGKYEEALSKVESLGALALKVGAEVGKVQNQLENSKELQRIVNLMQNPASATYAEYAPTVFAIATLLHKWVRIHEQKFKFAYSIKSGLECLMKDLGGP